VLSFRTNQRCTFSASQLFIVAKIGHGKKPPRSSEASQEYWKMS
jgi:hypothetical protein